MDVTTTLCSEDWDASNLPAWGSAKDARVIVCVEVGGSWGKDAVAGSGLPTPDGAVLYLVRTPGQHVDSPQQRQVIVSGGFGDVPWLVTGKVSAGRLEEFLTSDVASEQVWERFALTPTVESTLLVCTNGKRDACCAVRGRPVVEAAHTAAPERVWEVSHIGGHRFAPTAIHLPTGQTFGRLSPQDGATLAAAGRSGTLPAHLFDAAHHRGRTDLTSAQRVAETFWRTHAQEFALTPALVFEQLSDDSVRLPDGRVLTVTAHDGPQLRDSCVKLPKKSSYFEAEVG